MKNTNNPRVDVVFDFKKEASATKKGTVHVRIYNNRRRTYASTGVRLYPAEWSETWHVINRPDANILNKKIDEAINEAKRQIKNCLESQTELPTAKQLKIPTSSAPFLDWLLSEMESADVSAGTRKHYMTLYSSLSKYGAIRKFDDVNHKAINAFLQHLKSTKNIQKVINGELVTVPISQNSLRNYYKILAKFVRVAQRQHLLPLDVLLGVECKRAPAPRREHLSDAELQKWMEVPLHLPHHLRARDLFLLQCATGLAYSDLMSTDFSQVEKFGEMYALSGRRTKTKEDYFIVVLPFAIPIIQKYNQVLPNISNQKYNVYLSEVARLAGINKHVTSHIGRHTYACTCLSRGVRIEAVQKALGHAQLATTQIYAKLVNQDVLSAFATAFSSPTATPESSLHQNSGKP